MKFGIFLDKQISLVLLFYIEYCLKYAFRLQCVLFGGTYAGNKLSIFFLIHIDMAILNGSVAWHQQVSGKMHQCCMTACNKFLCEFDKKSLPVSKELHKNYQDTEQKNRDSLCLL